MKREKNLFFYPKIHSGIPDFEIVVDFRPREPTSQAQFDADDREYAKFKIPWPSVLLKRL